MSGSLALRLLGAEELLTRSEAFRDHVGAADADSAKDSVYFGELADVLALVLEHTLDVKRPCAIVGVQRHEYVQIGQGARIEMGASGAVWVLFVDKPADPNDHKASFLAFTDWASQVLDEVTDEVGHDTLWPFHAATMFLEPFRPDIADRQSDDYFVMGYVLTDNINAPG
jgi:hypothetical protein